MRLAILIVFPVLVWVVAGCSYFLPDPPCPPPPSAKCPITPTFSCSTATVPIVLPPEQEPLALSDLVDLALQNSPLTRSAWYGAKQAAATLGAARGAYLPPLIVEGMYAGSRTLEVIQEFEVGVITNNYGPQLSTSYLIYDFGGRDATVESALDALISLNWTYNFEVQTVMITTITSYYNYMNALGIVAANEATVKDNIATVDAATARRIQGVTSLSDELQARTSLVQSQITLEQAIGTLNIAKANLATALGIMPDIPLSVQDLPDEFPFETVCHDMEVLLMAAKNNRADLMALRATVLENRANIKSAFSNAMPNLTTTASGGYQWINGLGPDRVYSVDLTLSFALFNSFNDVNAIRLAEAALLEAQANLDDAELQAFLAVLSDYYTFLASTSILKYSREYIRIATKNQEVAFANYRAGVTTIIDLMTANNALNTARQQLINAKINWLTSLANLAYDTGGLSIEDIQPNQEVIPSLVETCETCMEAIP